MIAKLHPTLIDRNLVFCIKAISDNILLTQPYLEILLLVKKKKIVVVSVSLEFD
jgi:hypothetical protein